MEQPSNKPTKTKKMNTYDQDIEEEILKDIITEYKKTDPQKYHSLMIGIIKDHLKNIKLPPRNTIEKYNDGDIEEEYNTKKEERYKLWNLNKFFTHAYSHHPEDKNLETINKYLNQLKYVIDQIEQTENEKENQINKKYLEHSLITLNKEINEFTNKYEKILKHINNNETKEEYIYDQTTKEPNNNEKERM